MKKKQEVRDVGKEEQRRKKKNDESMKLRP